MKKFASAAAAIAALGFVNSANAADMPIKMPVKAAPMVAPDYNWTGLYVGGVGTYGWGNSQHCQIGVAAPLTNCDPTFPQTEPAGWQGGATVGYNWQSDRWVLGVEGDWSWGKLNGSSLRTTNFGCGAAIDVCITNIKSTETLRGRLGWAFDRFLPYATAGIAWNQLNASMGSGTFYSSGDTTKSSFVVGGGLEYAFLQNLSAKIEYLHIVQLGDFTFDSGAACGATRPCYVHVGAINVVRFGLNYRFTGL